MKRRNPRNEPMSLVNTFQKCSQCERVLLLLSFVELEWTPHAMPKPRFTNLCSECRFNNETKKPASEVHTGQQKQANSLHDFDGDGSMAGKLESKS